ncbi:hypothetical protein D9M72_224350 [compost metagenome]
MEFAQHPCCHFVGHGLDVRLRKQLVGALREVRQIGDRLERLFVHALKAVEPAGDLLERVLLEFDLVRHASAALALMDPHGVEARRQQLDAFEHRDDLRVLLLRDLAGDKDAEMADAPVHQADDHLAAGLDLLGAAVDVHDPVKGLLRGGDVVAHRGEQHDRRADFAQIERLATGPLDITAPEFVADEQIASDPFDLLAVHQVVAAPPALELQEARRLGIDLPIQVVVLVPETVGWIQVLEILHQPSAIELAVAEVRRVRGQPGPAQQSAGIAHRVVAFALAPGTTPVRHGRAVDHDGPGVIRVRGAQHHRGPAALAIADDGWLGAVRMQRAHPLDELLLGLAYVQQGLSRLGIAKEDDEIDRVAGPQGHSHLRVVLEAADARAVPGARIDDDIGAAAVIDRDAIGRSDLQQRIVDGPFQLTPIRDGLVAKMQDRLEALHGVFDKVVAPLP